MIIKKLVPVLGISAALLAACTDQVPEIPASELYTRAFVKEFGVVNGAQDWNNATRGSVNVSLQGQAAVQVTAKINGRNYLLANYSDVSGTRSLSFDMPRGVKDITVVCGSRQIGTTVGGTVDFGSVSRTVKDPASEGAAGVTAELITDPDHWMVVPLLNATMFRSKMPENRYNVDRAGVTADFTFKFKEHDVIVRPLYWQTNQQLEFGFFTLGDDGNPVYFPIYDMEKTDTWSEDLVLSYTIPETRSITIPDYVNNADFLACLAAQGVDIIEAENKWNGSMKGMIMNVGDSDNFYTTCSSADDRKVTFACRAYLEKLGYINDRDADPDKRYNYVYRWHTVGESVVDNTADHGTGWCKDFEIVFTHFDSNFPEKAKAMGTNQEMGPAISNSNNLRNYDQLGYPALVSKGIKVHFDDIDRAYGAYIKNAANGYMHSMSSLNTNDLRLQPKEGAVRNNEEWVNGVLVPSYSTSDFEVVPGKHAHRAVTWVGTKYSWRYMSFEDGMVTDTYQRGSCDYDMQDFVFILDSDDIEYDDPVDDVVDPEKPQPIKWLIACEDLGALDDFDFNDVVFEVEHVAGERKAKITPLAAGGTLETYLMRAGEIISGEWHDYFGGAQPTQMMNTTVITHHPEPFEIDVPEDFSISSSLGGEGYRKNMGDFHIKVVRSGGEETDITPPGPGEAPQMMLIFQPEGKPWCWPIERHHIKLAYPKFADWISTGSYEVTQDGENWFDSATDMHVVKR